MKRKDTAVWFIAMLCLVLGCENSEKSAKTETVTVPNTPKLKDTVQQVPPIPKNTPNDIYSQAAIETCNCMQPMVDKAKKLKEFEKNKQLSEIKKMASEMEQIRPQIQKCSDVIRKKYAKISGVEDEKPIRKALSIQCPDMATLFSSLSKIVKN